jgi:hypothetical protein
MTGPCAIFSTIGMRHILCGVLFYVESNGRERRRPDCVLNHQLRRNETVNINRRRLVADRKIVRATARANTRLRLNRRQLTFAIVGVTLLALSFGCSWSPIVRVSATCGVQGHALRI